MTWVAIGLFWVAIGLFWSDDALAKSDLMRQPWPVKGARSALSDVWQDARPDNEGINVWPDGWTNVRLSVRSEALAALRGKRKPVTNPEPVVTKPNPVPKLKQMTGGGFWQESFLQAIRFFQIFISPADGDRCPMYPSCSQYAVEAVRTYGPWRGVILTSDRLLRCGREDDYPLIKQQGNFRYYDPLGDNILWP